MALESVEVLRDGASAQYGSDAIAGVVNLRLREADHGGGITASQGLYVTNFNTARTSDRSVTGETVTSASAWQGLKLGGDGFLTISADYQHRDATNRADADPRATPAQVLDLYGDPRVNQYSAYANFGKPLSAAWKLYGWLGFQYRDSTSAAQDRLASAYSAYGVTALYPTYFVPQINTHTSDLNAALGVKGDVDGWAINTRLSYGRNAIKLYTNNSVNYSYGAASPTSFYDGQFKYDQLIGGVDGSKSLAIFKSLNVAWGAEVRHETYGISAGDPASYSAGTAFPTASYIAQGYGGLSPANAVNAKRTSESAYLDLEAQATDQLRLGAAGRFEHYSDFGSTGTGKVSARYDVSHAFALRATGSTGFRAPALQQEYYTSVNSVISNGQIYLTGTLPSTSAIATQLGGKPLQPERSASASAGFVARAGGFDLTVDGYYTHVRNAIALSENLGSSALTPSAYTLIQSAGLQQVRFFINGLGITAKGIDAVGHYKLRTDAAGTFDLTLAGNINQRKVTSTPALVATQSNLALFGRNRVLSIEEGAPDTKVTGSLEWTGGKLGATLRATYYGNVTVPGSVAANDYSTGAHTITDVELRYQPKETALNLAIGANNLFDIYPHAVPASLNTNGLVAFPYYSPFGFNGRFVYVRAGLHW